ncbi:MAG: metal-dependent transcriptional regulator [Phycisphaeraceae bacterium]|nr:metal-dependent transcriptional regulator [Phycisphaeraceae bacterium]
MAGMPSKASDHHSAAVEDYIKQIWKLQRKGTSATTKAIAERLELGRGTVSGMLKHLADRNLVDHEPYRGVRLTEAGEKLALQMVRRHRLIELFLVRTLGLGWEQVHRDAERIEHAVSEQLIETIDRYLGRPDTDPHGAPIPNASGQFEPQHFQNLNGLEPGSRGRVRRVADSDPQFLRHLDSLNLGLGCELKVLEIDPFGSMKVELEGKPIHLAREATERIQVEAI